MLATRPTELLSSTAIQEAVARMAADISRDLAGREVTVLPVFTGALFFAVDLLRGLRGVDPRVVGIEAKSYTQRRSGDLKLPGLPRLEGIRDRDLLVVDDILDTGKTLHTIVRELEDLGPRSIRIAVLLRKSGCQDPAHPIEPDYVGFDIPDRFVVGYGLDDEAKYRNLDYIGYLPE